MDYIKHINVITTYRILFSIFLSRLTHLQTDLLRIINVDFDAIDFLLIRYLHSSDSKKKWEYNVTVHQLLINFMNTYDFVWREVLYSIIVEIVIPI
jgi:hypothetical protein